MFLWFSLRNLVKIHKNLHKKNSFKTVCANFSNSVNVPKTALEIDVPEENLENYEPNNNKTVTLHEKLSNISKYARLASF